MDEAGRGQTKRTGRSIKARPFWVEGCVGLYLFPNELAVFE